VTLHVPLERKGPDATVDMADRRFFRALRQGVVFLNTSRGQVVVEEALAEAIDRQKVSLAILDVWQNEPEIDEQLVRRAFLGTADIAGYSHDGKVNATLMVCEALCEYLQRRMDVTASGFLPPPEVPRVDLSKLPGSDQDVLREAIRHVYDIRKDDLDLRRAVRDKKTRGKRFDMLRKACPHRRKFHNTELVLPAGRATLARKAEALGFRIERV